MSADVLRRYRFATEAQWNACLQVQAASVDLLPAVGTTVAQGRYLNAATAREPVAVLGAQAARRLGIDRVFPGQRVWLGGKWFYVAGILRPAVLASEIDRSVLVEEPQLAQTRSQRTDLAQLLDPGGLATSPAAGPLPRAV